jgi:hypothetical protein
MSDAARNKTLRQIARAMKKAAKAAAPSGTRISDQDLMNALKALKGQREQQQNMGGQKKKSGGKVKKK